MGRKTFVSGGMTYFSGHCIGDWSRRQAQNRHLPQPHGLKYIGGEERQGGPVTVDFLN
jgi:hypothetical protein